MISRYIKRSFFIGIAAVSFAACTPDTIDGDGNGINQNMVDGTFNVTKNTENRYTLTTNANNYITTKWSIDGDAFKIGKNIQDLFLPDEGIYVIKHQAIGIGGVVAGTDTKTITVATSDPVYGNMIKGGRFDTAADASKWTVHTISASGAQWVLYNPTGMATFVASASNQQAIYQPIQVEAGQQYSIDMSVKSDTPLEDTWFEVYVVNSIPAQGQDISGTVYRNINTWDGCGKAAFNDKISAIGCNGDKNGGVYTASTTGTVYFVIKCGGKTVNSLSIDKVEFRRMQ